MLGLVWDDVDFEQGFLRLRYQLDRNRQRVALKTPESRRDVVLTPQLARTLKEHRLASRYSAPTDFLFPAPDGRGRDHRSTSKGIERAVARAGLGEGISSHVFRHTFASVLIVAHAAIFNVVDAQKVGLPAIDADQDGEQWQRIWRLWAKYWAMGPPRVYEGVRASVIEPWPEPN